MDLILFLLVVIISLLIFRLFRKPECSHTECIYYDAAGDELPGDQSDACFCKCKQCGQVSVIPSGFQSDAHFEHYLYESEQGGSKALKKIKGD